MNFVKCIDVDIAEALKSIGYTSKADENTEKLAKTAAKMLEKVASPRWVYKEFALEKSFSLGQTQVILKGQSIKKHLEGCEACIILAVTLGDGVERETRAAQTQNMALAVVLDALASTLAEQYADEAQDILAEMQAEKSMFLSPRFSPGYGDLPIALQRDFLQILNAQREIGLFVSQSGILLPRKSITAVLGIAKQPVKGQLARCENCAIFASCGGTKPCATIHLLGS